MLGPFVCLQCRRYLLQQRHWIRHIGFVSLNPSTGVSDDNTLGNDDAHGASKRNERIAGNAFYRRTSGPSRRLPQKPTRSSSSTDSALQSLFASNQRSKLPPSRLQYSVAQDAQHTLPSRGLPIFESLSKRFYGDDTSLQEVWHDCKELLGTLAKQQAAAPSRGKIAPRVSRLFKDVLFAIARRNVQAKVEPGFPRPHQVIHKYIEFGVMKDWWTLVLWPHLAAIVKHLYSLKNSGVEDNTFGSKERIVELMQEVLDICFAFTQKHASHPATPLELQQWHIHNTTTAKAAFMQLFPQFHQTQSLDRILEACKTTHQCYKTLLEDKRWTLDITQDRQRIIELLGYLFENRRLPLGQAKVYLALEGVADRIISRVLNFPEGWGEKPIVYPEALLPSKIDTMSRDDWSPDDWESDIDNINQIIVALEQREQKLAMWIQEIRSSLDGLEPRVLPLANEILQPKSEPKDVKWSSDEIHRNVTTLIIDLQRATERHDIARVAAIWQRYQGSDLANAYVGKQSREQIYSSFLSSFFALSRPEQAVHVWNDMLQANITPNERHWNSMLSCSVKARDAASVEEIWKNMLAAGIEPDQTCWATYINGLIMCGKWQRGLRVLHDLGAQWRKAQTSRAKPGIAASGSAP
ncbi:MAG: hypothetical protein Q9218_004013, partial [Villophora microphyllina]